MHRAAFVACCLVTTLGTVSCGRPEPRRPDSEVGEVPDHCPLRQEAAFDGQSQPSAGMPADMGAFLEAIDATPQCAYYYRELAALYDSLRACKHSSDCVLVHETNPHVDDLRIAVVAGDAARAKLLAFQRGKPQCSDMMLNVHAARVFRPVCVAGRCEACLNQCPLDDGWGKCEGSSACQRCEAEQEAPWLDLARRENTPTTTHAESVRPPPH